MVVCGSGGFEYGAGGVVECIGGVGWSYAVKCVDGVAGVWWSVKVWLLGDGDVCWVTKLDVVVMMTEMMVRYGASDVKILPYPVDITLSSPCKPPPTHTLTQPFLSLVLFFISTLILILWLALHFLFPKLSSWLKPPLSFSSFTLTVSLTFYFITRNVKILVYSMY